MPNRIQQITCAALLCLAFGCGGGHDDGRLELQYWRTLTGGAGDAQDALVERFNGSQDAVRVSAEFQGSYADLATKLTSAMAAGAGTGPAVTQLGTYEIREFARQRFLVDLRPYVEGPNGLDTSDWPGSILKAGEVDGRLCWLPFNVTVPVLYYNRDAFVAAGLNGPPETWSDFFVYATKLTVRDDDGVVQRHGVALWDETWPLLSMIWSAGGEITDPLYNEITFDHPATIVIFNRLQAMVQAGNISIPASATGGHRAAFTSGKAAMILDSPAPYEQIMRQAAGFTAGIANYPSGAAGKVYAPGGGGLAILATATEEERDAAWEFIRFMLQPEQIAFYAERSGYCAFTPASQQAAGAWIDEPDRAVIHAALPHLRGDFSVVMSPTIRNLFQNAFARILIKLEDPETVLKEEDAVAEATIGQEMADR